jgi:hypothetical protein
MVHFLNSSFCIRPFSASGGFVIQRVRHFFMVRDVETNLDHIHRQALDELEDAASSREIEDISIRYLGRKGILTQFLRNISKLPAEERPTAGKRAGWHQGRKN